MNSNTKAMIKKYRQMIRDGADPDPCATAEVHKSFINVVVRSPSNMFGRTMRQQYPDMGWTEARARFVATAVWPRCVDEFYAGFHGNR